MRALRARVLVAIDATGVAGASVSGGPGTPRIRSFARAPLSPGALVPGPFMTDPKGIRDISEWYMATRSRRPYVHSVFERQCELGIANLARIHERVGNEVYAEENDSYGLTTLMKRHVSVSGATVYFRFPAKSVNRPPASSTMTSGAARSHTDTIGSSMISAPPSATSL